MSNRPTTATLRLIVVGVGISVVMLSARSDLVVLENGESLSGALVRVRDNTLVFRTSLGGQMMSPMTNVKSLVIDGPLYIRMVDGQVFYGTLTVKEGAPVVLPLDGTPAVPISLENIQETLAIPKPLKGQTEAEEPSLRPIPDGVPPSTEQEEAPSPLVLGGQKLIAEDSDQLPSSSLRLEDRSLVSPFRENRVLPLEPWTDTGALHSSREMGQSLIPPESLLDVPPPHDTLRNIQESTGPVTESMESVQRLPSAYRLDRQERTWPQLSIRLYPSLLKRQETKEIFHRPLSNLRIYPGGVSRIRNRRLELRTGKFFE